MAVEVHYAQYTLNNGEVSYRFESRGDHPKYRASLYKCENFYPLTVGGVKYRNGSRWVATLTGLSRPIPFVFNKIEAYVLVFSDLLLTIYHPDGTLVATTPTFVTVFAEANIPDLYVFQSADVMYICSGDFPVYKLSRLGAEEFELVEAVFYAPGTIIDEPTGEDLQAGTTLTPGAATGNGVTFTLSNGVAVGADIGRIIVSGTSRGVITAEGTTTYTVDIISAFPTSTIASTDWRLTGSPDGTANPSKIKKGNRLIITFSVPNAIRTIDIGKYIAIYGGFVRITKILGGSPWQIEATIVSDLKEVAPNVNPDPTGDWTVWRPAWTAQYGYPTCGTFFQGRMYLCKDITIWGSVVNDIENFALGTGDDDGINRPISDDEVNDIRWVVGTNHLYFGTIGGCYTAVSSSDGGPLTTNDFNVQHISTEGSERIKPVRAHGQILIIQYGARKVRELVFDFVENRTKSPNMMALADHITENSQLTGIAFQQDPDSLVWLPLDNGQLAILAYNRDEELVGWSRFVTPNGCFYDVCSVPNGDTGNDRVFAVVLRNDIWTLEYFDQDAELAIRQWNGLYTDGAIVVDGTLGFSVSGLAHHEGQTVTVVGDGLIYDEAVVTGGSISITPEVPAIQFEIGLQYEGRLETLEPIIPPQFGAPWTTRGWVEIGARIRQTLGIEMGVMVREDETNHEVGKEIKSVVNFRKQHHDPVLPLPPQRGKVCKPGYAHDGVSRILLLQNTPLPAEIIGLFGMLEIGDKPRCETFDEPAPVFPCVLPPPVPPVIECPDEPTASHIHEGFTNILNDTAAVYRATAPDHNYAAYYGSTGGDPFLTTFDMDDMVVLADGAGNGLKVHSRPAIDAANGGLYALRATKVGSNVRMAEWDPNDLSAVIREGPDFSFSGQGSTDLKVGTNFIFLSTSLSRVFIIDKASLTLQFTYIPADANHTIQRVTVDDNDNAWGVTRQIGGAATVNNLMKLSSGGVLTSFDVTATMGAPTLSPSLTFDVTNDCLILWNPGTNKLGKFDLGSETMGTVITWTESIFNELDNYPYGGTFWHRDTSAGFSEFQISTMTDIQTVLWADVVNMYHITSGMGRYVFMPSINCLHMSHGTVSAISPLGGVDKVCLPCPQPAAFIARSGIRGQSFQSQQIQRAPSIVPSLP